MSDEPQLERFSRTVRSSAAFPERLVELEAENERLKAQVRGHEGAWKILRSKLGLTEEPADYGRDVLDAVDAMKADAERWRFVEIAAYRSDVMCQRWLVVMPPAETFSAAVDAAMSAAKEPKLEGGK
jgi:hypothetical protein